MSIARAFTTRRVKQSLQAAEAEHTPQRSNTLKGSVGSIRNKISSPVNLVHTTNMLSYNAPDIHPMTASSTRSSPRSDDDMSDSAHTSGTTPPTSPDIESSPKKKAVSAEPNHLSCYFTAPGQTTASAAKSQAPIAPQRASSHSKKPYGTMERQHSISRTSEQSQRTVSTKASFSFSRSSPSTSTSTSLASQNPLPPHHKAKLAGPATAPAASFAAFPPPKPQPHRHREDPFGPELAQVSEIAEEFGVKEQLNVVDADEQAMLAKGLLKFSADEYLREVQGLFANFFTQPEPAVTTSWI
ncbi:hypothetical protein VTK56DRAFT_9949 [Thermocarpiscus australiensis]